MLGGEPRWVRRGIHIFRFVVAVLAALFLLAQALNAKKEWNVPTKLYVGLAIAVGVCGVIEVTVAALRDRAQRSWEERRTRITKAITGALVDISDASDQKIADMGGSVLVVRQSWLKWEWNGRPRRSEYLHRIVRFRLKDVPQASSVAWTSGKGCIGQAWRTKTGAYQHWGPTADKYADGTLTEETFNALSETERGSFTYDEFREIVAKYAEIYAIPIMSEHGDKVLGVLSVDRRFHPSTYSAKILEPIEARATVEAAATTIREDLV